MAEPEASSARPPAEPEHPAARPASKWIKYGTPLLVVLLAVAVVVTITYSWNSSEGGRAEQQTDDAYVRGDVTPLSTKIPGLVREVKVSDFQQVRKGDLLVQLDDDDYQAQVAQATAALEAAKAAIVNNVRQQQLQDTKIESAQASVDRARAGIAAAVAGKAAVQADITRTTAERQRQESLLAAHASTQQKVEQAVADEERFAAQAASRDADLDQARALLKSSELAVEAERRGKDVLESQAALLAADLRARQATLTLAQVDLGYTRITAPADGSVGERQVHPGQLVSPGTQVIAFIDASRWVQANYRETQLTHMKPGDAAEVRVDAYPGQVFRGTVAEIAPASGSQFALLPPDNATGNYTKVVQRIPVKIALDASSAGRLRPGLSVVATVRVKD